jgi:uncharacterized protein with PIN domain
MQNKKFIITRELGKLAKWLRILGYDSVYYREKDIPGIVIQAMREKRVLLTRSAEFTKYKGMKAVVIKHDLAEEQLEQVTEELGLALPEGAIFHICVECNTPLEGIEKEQAKERVPEYVFKTQEEFKRCPKCDKIFWKGTHWDMATGWLHQHGIEEKGENGTKKNNKNEDTLQ